MSRAVIWFALALLLGGSAAVSSAATEAGIEPGELQPAAAAESEGARTLRQELIDGFGFTLRALAFGVNRGVENLPAAVKQGFHDDSFNLSNHQVEVDLRPDFKLDFRSLELSVKPRLELEWNNWDKERQDGQTSTAAELFVNEWLARYALVQNLFVSYGRENLQWGPSFLTSPSNPFIRDNGRNNPYLEVPGADFARMVWAASSRWSVSFIANTDKGRQPYLAASMNGEELFPGFERGYACKIDYTADKKFLSLIPQYKENGNAALGFYGGWNVSDSVILYSEGRVSDSEWRILAGSSYSFAEGAMVSAEYYYNSQGSTRDPFLSVFPPTGDVDPNDQYYRKNYMLLQFADTRIRDVFDVTLRWICNLDDGSARYIATLEYSLGDRLKLFTVGDYDSGSSTDEFGSILRYSVFAGMQYVY